MSRSTNHITKLVIAVLMLILPLASAQWSMAYGGNQEKATTASAQPLDPDNGEQTPDSGKTRLSEGVIVEDVVFATLPGDEETAGAVAAAQTETPVEPAATQRLYFDPTTGQPIADSDKPRLSTGIIVEDVVFADVATGEAQPAEASAFQQPTITIFYSDTQKFGNLGKPQRWINVLGRVSNPRQIVSLAYILNGGPAQPLSMGPDRRRLPGNGDFNVEIDTANLVAGANTVVITAINNNSQVTSTTVTVNYQPGTVWPASYVADWSTSTNIQDIAQVVDGEWRLEDNQLRTVSLGYDRLVAIGDVSWIEYEVVAPVTVLGLNPDPNTFRHPSYGAGIGFLLRWQGHYLEANEQPTIGWKNFGALGWYHWDQDAAGSIIGGVQLLGYAGRELAVKPAAMAFNTEYMLKMSVQTSPTKPSYYRFKMWPANTAEPYGWDVEKWGVVGEPATGSLLLVAHNVDVRIGAVTVRPLSEIGFSVTTATDGNGTIQVTPPPTTTFGYGDAVRLRGVGNLGKMLNQWGGSITGSQNPYVFYITQDTHVTASFVDAPPPTISAQSNGKGRVIVTPQKPVYDFGEAVTLTASPEVGFAFIGWSGSFGGVRNPRTITMTTSISVTANFGDAVPPVSDDFNRCTLNETVWTVRDQLGDVQLVPNGEQLQIVIPGTVDHDVWEDNNLAPRLMQSAVNDDWGLEIKFDSQPVQRFQTQGLIIEQDAENFMRLDYYHDGTVTRAFAAIFENGLPTVRRNIPITAPAGLDMYIRVTRAGDTWSVQWRSLDGVTWRVNANITAELQVTAVGIFAGNAKPNAENPPPAFTALVDYFFLSSAPLVPEDSNPIAPNVQIVGDGTITHNPDKTTYSCNESVQLTANPATGSVFVGWSGALSGRTNPATLTVDPAKVVTATFAVGDVVLTTPTNGLGTVERSPAKLAFATNEQVTLTATPTDGWTFAGWTGAVASSENPLVVTMDMDKEIGALFVLVGGEQIYLPLVQSE